MIIDAHTHVFDRHWGYGPRGESWPAGDGRIRFATGAEMRILPEGMPGVAFTAEMLLEQMDGAGVDRAILLQAGLYGFHNQYACDAARKYPDRLSAAYTLDPFVACAGDIMHRIGDMGGRILKFEISSGSGLTGIHPYFRLDGPEMECVFEFMAGRDGTIVLDLGSPGMASYQVDLLRGIVRSYPGIRFVVCHLLAPDGTNGSGWEKDILSLASDNVWFDIAAMPWNIREPYPYPSSLRHVERAKALIGADRLIWGSDIPLLLTIMSYRQSFEYLRTSKDLTAPDLEKILAANARVAYAI